VKRITLIGIVIVGLIAAVAVVGAFMAGKKSPIYVAGQVVIPQEQMAEAAKIDTLFLVIYDENSPMPMPYGAVKERLGTALQEGQSTIDFMITKEKIQLMNERAGTPRSMRVKARLDRDGIAGRDQPGDLTGEVQHIGFGARDVTIKIDHVAD
jgi:hypothetical protein